MKKIILILSLLGFNNIALAESFQAVIFNMSEKYDISVTYQICSYSENQSLCDPEKTILINAKKTPETKNFSVITEPTKNPNIYSKVLNIMSTVEKDDNGNIISKGKYFDDSKNLLSNCSGMLYLNETTYSHVGDTELILDDMHSSPYITCVSSYFVAEDNNL